jgi:hypothetical protein
VVRLETPQERAMNRAQDGTAASDEAKTKRGPSVEMTDSLPDDQLSTVTGGYGGGATGKVQFQDFHFNKRCD